MVSGRKPNWDLRRQVGEMRFQNLTLQEIASRLGITRQAVHSALRAPQGGKPVVVCCRICSTQLDPSGALPKDAPNALCLDCLARRPLTGFGVRLLAFRLAAGLSRAQLAEQARMSADSIRQYEAGKKEPRWRPLAKLIRVLGGGLVTLGLVGEAK